MRSLTWNEIGLVGYVALNVAIPFLVLLFDAWLDASGRMTITEHCRANPPLAAAVLSVIGVGFIGLAVHFMAVVPVER